MINYNLNNNEVIKVINLTVSDIVLNRTNTGSGIVFLQCTKGKISLKVNLFDIDLSTNKSEAFFPSERITVTNVSSNFKGRLFILNNELFREALVRLDLSVIGEFLRLRLAKKGRISSSTDNPMYGDLVKNAYLFSYNTFENLNLIAQQPDNRYKYDQVLCQLRSLFCFASSTIEIWRKNNSNAFEPPTYNRMEEHFKKFMELVSKHYKESREVSFYAQKMSLTPKYLNYISCSITKRTCKQIINTYVVNQLKNDLRYSDKNIQEIAYEYNFANQSFLGSFFKKLVGVSPRAFRNEKES